MNKYLPLVLFLLPGCSYHPKYKAGDCVAFTFNEPVESWERRAPYEFSRKILEIGRANYRTQYWYGQGQDSWADRKLEVTQSIDWVDDRWTQIDCKTLEPK